MNYQNIIDKALAMGFEEVEIYASNSEGNTIKLFQGELSNYNSSDIYGVSIRGLYQGKMGYIYVEKIDEDNADEILNTLKNNTLAITTTEEEHVYGGNVTYQEVPEVKSDYHEHSLPEKIALLQYLEKTIKEFDKRIVQIGYCQFIEHSGKTTIVNSKGLNLTRSNSYMVTVIGAAATDGTNTTMGFSQDISIKFDEIDKQHIIDETTQSALNALGAEKVDSGTYPVIFGKDPATDILQAFSSIFMGEAALRKLTILTDKVNTLVFGKNINIIDDPFHKNAIMQIPFDDEGVPCRTKYIVENGVFKGFMHSLKTAKHFNTEPTGNGFKASTASPVTTSTTNFYLQPGEKTEEELIASVEKGIYVTEVNGLHAGLNPISGSFNVQSSGFLIENGKKTKPITLFVISGNFYEMLNDVKEIANNLNKHFVEVASPSILVGSLKISGK